MVTLFGSVPPELAVPIRRRPRGVTANAEIELLPALTFTSTLPSRDTTIECPPSSAPPSPPGVGAGRVSDPSLPRANASIALPLAEFVMVYTAPAVPGPSAAWAGPAKAASPPAAASPMAPAAAARIRRGIALRSLTAV